MDTPRQAQRSGAGRRNGASSPPDLTSAAIAAQRLGGGRPRAAPVSRQTGRGRGRDVRPAPGVLSRLKQRLSAVASVKVLVGSTFSLVLLGIVANATLLQKGRHPAPLFGSLQAAPDVEPLATLPAHPPAQGATRPSAVATSQASPPQANDGEPAGSPAPAVAGEQSVPVRTVTARKVATRPQHDDGIGRLLRGQPLASDPESVASVPDPSDKKPDAALMAAQRQLAKLGFVVKADGRMGAATRDALRLFEHEHHLGAETGNVTPHLRHEIATAVAEAAKAR